MTLKHETGAIVTPNINEKIPIKCVPITVILLGNIFYQQNKLLFIGNRKALYIDINMML